MIEELKNRPVERIGSGSGNSVGHKSRGSAVLGGKIGGTHPVFFHRVGRDQGGGTGNRQVVVVHAIQKEVGAAHPLAVDGKAQAASRGIVGTDAGLQHQQCVNVATGER